MITTTLALNLISTMTSETKKKMFYRHSKYTIKFANDEFIQSRLENCNAIQSDNDECVIQPTDATVLVTGLNIMVNKDFQ